MATNIHTITLKEKEKRLPFCRDSTGKPLKLVRFYNPLDVPADIIIKGLKTANRYTVHPKDTFQCVMCGKSFVQPVSTLMNDGKTLVKPDETEFQLCDEDVELIF